MEFRHLRYVVAVAEAGSLVAAARRLRVAQQSLSAQVADLEQELGVALFVRHPRGMALSPAGAEFLAHARAVLARAQVAVEHVRRVGAGADRPVLRVGLYDVGGGPAQGLVARGIAAFRAAYPHVALTLVPTPFLRQATLVAEERLDVGFHSGLAPEGDGVAGEVLFADPLAGALLPGSHPLAAAPELTPADLARVPVVSFPHALHAREIDDELARMRETGWRGRLDHELDSGPAILSMVAYGAGWSHMPRSFAGASVAGAVYRPLAWGGGTPFDLHAVTRPGEAGAGGDPLAGAFLACLRAARDEPTVGAAPAA